MTTETSGGRGSLAARVFAERGDRAWAAVREPRTLRFEFARFGVDVAVVEPEPFPTGLIASGSVEDRRGVLDEYGDLSAVPSHMLANFEDFLQAETASDNQQVFDASMALAEAAPGSCPMRTIVGMDFGVTGLSRIAEGIREGDLQELDLTSVLVRP